MDEDAAVARVESPPALAVEYRRGAAGGGGGNEAADRALLLVDEAEERRPAVALAVATAEGGVGQDPEPGLAYEGGADKVRGLLRRDPEEDLAQNLVHQLRRRGRAARRRRHGGFRRRRRHGVSIWSVAARRRCATPQQQERDRGDGLGQLREEDRKLNGLS